MIVKLNVDEAVRSIQLGKKSAIEIYYSKKNYSSFYLQEIINDCKENLLRISKKSIEEMIKGFEKIFKIISAEDRIKLAMECRIEDINKYRYLIQLCTEELKRRKTS